MNTSFWKVPVWELPVAEGNKIELFRIPGRNIISEKEWPESFWSQVQNRHWVDVQKIRQVLDLFQGLELDDPARCHIPPWGLAVYRDTDLLFTTTLCFESSNAYVYTASGKNLRAFNVSEAHTTALFDFLQEQLPLT